MSSISLAIIAIWARTSAFEAWIYKVGQVGLLSRIIFGAGGVVIRVPELYTGLLGFALLAGVVAFNLIGPSRKNISNA